MSLYEINGLAIRDLRKTTFEAFGLKEPADLQQLFKRQINVIAPGLMVVTEEFDVLWTPIFGQLNKV